VQKDKKNSRKKQFTGNNNKKNLLQLLHLDFYPSECKI